MTSAIAEPETFSLVARTSPLRFTERVQTAAPAGCTVWEAIARAGLDPATLEATVYVDDVEVPRERWRDVRPRIGAAVAVLALPRGGGGGGGGKTVLRILAMIVIAVLAAVTGQWYAFGYLGLAAGSTAGIAVAGAVTAVISVAGALAVNALIPPPSPDLGAQATQSGQSPITGSRNVLARYGTVGSTLGKVRVFPPMGALPYTEQKGKKRYFVQLFDFGTGPVEFSDVRIGENPLFEDDAVLSYTAVNKATRSFQQCELEIRKGTPSDAPLTLYPDSVHQENVGARLFGKIVLAKAERDPFTGELVSAPKVIESKWVTRRTQEDTEEISVEVHWPIGLVQQSSTGAKDRRVKVKFEYRNLATGGAWVEDVDGVDGELVNGEFDVTARKTGLVVAADSWRVPKGTYEVRSKRVSPEASGDGKAEYVDETYWSVLRSIRKTNPVSVQGHALAVLRIKETGQLTGIVDEFSAVCQRLLLDWDEGTQTWVERATSSPAAALRQVATGAENRRAVATSKLHLASLQGFSEFCESKGFTYNHYHDRTMSVRATLQQIARAGRGSITDFDGKLGVVWDDVKTTVRQTFSPRNSSGFSYTRVFPKLPHALKVRFRNKHLDWKWDERLVYDDGYSEKGTGGTAVATEFEAMEMAGVDDPAQVWSLGRYHLAVGRLVARDRYELSCGPEHLAVTRGDLCRTAHDVIDVGEGAGRVAAVNLDGSGDVVSIDVDEDFTMDGAGSYGVRIRRSSNFDTQIVRTITTVAGAQRTLVFSTPIPAASTKPEVGDLVLYGTAAVDSIEVVLISLRPRGDHTARLALVPYKSAVYTADQATRPDWARSIPAGEVVPDTRAPYDSDPEAPEIDAIENASGDTRPTQSTSSTQGNPKPANSAGAPPPPTKPTSGGKKGGGTVKIHVRRKSGKRS